MAICVAIEVNRSFDVESDFDTVFDLLADIPRSTSFFPKVQKLEPLGEGTYRWEMEKVGVDKHSIQVIYACRYRADKQAGAVSWTPVEGEGNGIVSGKWQVTEGEGGKTHLVFYTEAKINLALPSLLKLAVSPVVKHEFNSLVDQYVKNLQNHFGTA